MSAATMSAQTPSPGAVSPAAKAPGRFAGLRSIGKSLAINILGPYLVYVALEKAYPAPSLVPLLASAAVPALDLAWELLKRRRIDAVALISLSQLTAAVLISLFAHDPHGSLFGHAFQPLAFGLVFLVSTLAGHPLIIPLARQSMCGDDPEKQARFDATVTANPHARRHMGYVSLAWAAALFLETGARLVALQHMKSADYILFASVVGYSVPSVLAWLSIRYGDLMAKRMRAAGALAAKGEAASR